MIGDRQLRFFTEPEDRPPPNTVFETNSRQVRENCNQCSSTFQSFLLEVASTLPEKLIV
jgi:hypothetical protein